MSARPHGLPAPSPCEQAATAAAELAAIPGWLLVGDPARLDDPALRAQAENAVGLRTRLDRAPPQRGRPRRRAGRARRCAQGEHLPVPGVVEVARVGPGCSKRAGPAGPRPAPAVPRSGARDDPRDRPAHARRDRRERRSRRRTARRFVEDAALADEDVFDLDQTARRASTRWWTGTRSPCCCRCAWRLATGDRRTRATPGGCEFACTPTRWRSAALPCRRPGRRPTWWPSAGVTRVATSPPRRAPRRSPRSRVPSVVPGRRTCCAGPGRPAGRRLRTDPGLRRPGARVRLPGRAPRRAAPVGGRGRGRRAAAPR